MMKKYCLRRDIVTAAKEYGGSIQRVPKILFVILLLSIGMAIHAQETKLDSASYALGDKFVRFIVENKDSINLGFEFDKDNLAEVIRGVEENLVFMKYSQNISFGLGVMQAAFLSDGIQSKMDVIPFDCILAGLMKVVNHELTLPQDTIKAMEFIRSIPGNMKPEDLPDEDRCRFFTNYGIMKGLQPGLQKYIYEMTSKSEDEVPADYEAYAAGFAMIVKNLSLAAKQESELDPYSYGVSYGSSLVTQSLPFHFTEADFLDGCRAAAGMNVRKITVEESDRIVSTVFPEIYCSEIETQE